jgi:cadmium resistance protein CadD (predicted permease)
MKTQRIFPGIVLIGFGLYFFLEHSQIEIFPGFFSWPTLLCIVCIAFLIQAYSGNEFDSILPGVILLGFGAHFHIVENLDIWPDNIGIFILIISLGFILRARKTKSGMLYGMILFIISILILFYDKISTSFGILETSTANIEKFWPFVLMGIGVYILIRKK